jgi:D-inositol-3-phosphate glycosyltransferase
MKQIKLFYIDPMSYHNLAGYDFELLSKMDKEIDVSFYANVKFNMHIPNVNIIKIYSYSSKKGLSKAFSYFKSQIKLLFDIKKQRPNIVHFQWMRVPVLDYLLLKYIQRHSRVVYTSHNAFTHDDESKHKYAFIRILKTVDQVIVHTQRSKQELAMTIPDHKISIIRHGTLDLASYCRKTFDRHQLTKDIGQEKGIVFSALGTMDHYKGTDLLIAAWESSEILRYSREVKLIVAGKNKMGLKAKNLQAENIIFIERFIPDEEFLALLELSDLIALPYRSISQSGILLSAIVLKKRVLVSKAGELQDIFKHGNFGWVLEQTSVAGLRLLLEKIFELYQTDSLQPVNEDIWEQIKKAHAWETITRETSDLYKKLSRNNLERIRYVK